ncbi:MAG TPA: RagB/SusD family nutrient uptake outer membrane protein, partial [Puia sp.]|nr:RagB/SusD family nutrient uptake outer membrane protein [Puia sp.]
LTLFAGCKKLIDIPPPSNEIPQSAVFADSADIMNAMAGIYNNFGVTGFNPSFLSGLITLNTGLSGDELVPASTNQAADLEFFGNAISNINTSNEALWSNAYTSLYQINACLNGISASSAISPDFKQQLLGEILVNRALCYFNLVNLYGPVPLVTSTDYKVNQSLPRTPVDSLYDQILTDLAGARTKLTPAYPSAGRARPNVYAAEALLAKVYLYNRQWQKADSAATGIINSGLYSLNTDLNTVFLDGSNEAIWQILTAGSMNGQTPEASDFVPYASSVVPNYSLTGTLVAAFEPGDLRLQDWVGVNTVSENDSNVLYYYPYKYKNVSIYATPAEDYMVFRLAEVYLIRAEAQAQGAGNQIPGAIADLNVIRNRAGLPNYAGATDQGSVLAAIYHERQVELFCEWGNRWFDLKRTGAIDAVLGPEKPGWTATDSLYPVPLPELQNNPFLKQNTGY